MLEDIRPERHGVEQEEQEDGAAAEEEVEADVECGVSRENVLAPEQAEDSARGRAAEEAATIAARALEMEAGESAAREAAEEAATALHERIASSMAALGAATEVGPPGPDSLPLIRPHQALGLSP